MTDKFRERASKKDTKRGNEREKSKDRERERERERESCKLERGREGSKFREREIPKVKF